MWSGNGEKGKAYSEVPTQALLEEMSYWDDISPKRGKDELHAIGVSMRECPALIRIGMPQIARN